MQHVFLERAKIESGVRKLIRPSTLTHISNPPLVHGSSQAMATTENKLRANDPPTLLC